MAKLNVPAGTVFGKLTVLNESPKTAYGERRFRCQCECGEIRDFFLGNLRRGLTVSCGCYNNEKRYRKTLAVHPGQRFRKWVVIKEAEPATFPSGQRTRMVTCQCECGTIRDVSLNSLRQGGTSHCGCEAAQVASARFTTHGLSDHPLAGIWCAMISRCENSDNPGYHNYGGRGITVCAEWKESLSAFVAWAEQNGWQKGLQIDRINNDCGYAPENCRFVTGTINSRNTRHNRIITAHGMTKCLAEWAEYSGLPACLISSRIDSGWSEEDAVSIPKLRPGVRFRQAKPVTRGP
jgi:hypothetical protein